MLFIGTILCATMVHDTRILLASLVIAAIVSVSGFLIVSANPGNQQIRRAGIGVFIPVVFAALGFVLRASHWSLGEISPCESKSRPRPGTECKRLTVTQREIFGYSTCIVSAEGTDKPS